MKQVPVKGSLTLHDLERQWNKLRKDILGAYRHFRLFRDIVTSYEQRPSDFRRFLVFWNLTQLANRDAALHGLYRFYDNRSDTLTLRSFLRAVGASVPLIAEKGLRLPDASQLKRDLEMVDAKTNPRVATLIRYRHNFLAHRNRELALNAEAFVQRERLLYDDVQTTFGEGIDILERYGYLFGVDALARQVMPPGELVKILDAVNRTGKKPKAPTS